LTAREQEKELCVEQFNDDVGAQPYTIADKERAIKEMMKEIPVFNQVTINIQKHYD